ncbi:MAG: LCP family protein [Clostridium sp.]
MEENNIKKRKKKKKISIMKKILIGIGAFLGITLILILGGYIYYKNTFYQEINSISSSDEEQINFTEVDGITNVLLIGTDGRTLDENSRSDSMIIASIDKNNQNVKLASIMRDTLVDIPGHGQQKINAAYALGGIELLMKTIYQNFGVKLDKYVAVNFWGFESIIDEIGGLEVDIKDYEIGEINKFIGEATGGAKSDMITKSGVQKLDGQQALSYARIRKVGNGAYERDERQREVLFNVAEKIKSVNPLRWPGLATTLAGHVKTNIDIPQALNLAYTVYKMPVLEFQQIQIPQNELSWGGLYKNKGWVLLIDKEQNGKILKDFLFENKLPDSKTYNAASWRNQLAKLKDEEKAYNKENNINPDDHVSDDDKGKPQDEIPKPPVVEPEKPVTPPVEPEKPKDIDVTKYISVGMDIETAKGKLNAAGIKFTITNPSEGTKIKSFTQKIKPGGTVTITLQKEEPPKPDPDPTPNPNPNPGEGGVEPEKPVIKPE